MGLSSNFSLSSSEKNAYEAILKSLDGFSDRQREKIIAMVSGAISASKATSPKQSEDTYLTQEHGYHQSW